MKRAKKPLLILLSLILLLSPILSGCSLVSVVTETDGEASESAPAKTNANTTAKATETTATTAVTTEATTGGHTDPPPTPELTKKTVPDDPYTPTLFVPEYDEEYEDLIQQGKTELGASEYSDPARTVTTYERKLPLSCALDRAETRDELVEIASFHAFYRESPFQVALGYAATEAEEELDYLYYNSDLIPSLCSVSGSLADGVLQVNLIFYPESYLITPRDTVPAKVLGGENTPPNGTDTFPGLGPAHGVSVWDSEQAAYALSHGYAISPIAGSPAESLVNAAKTVLAGMIDDTMTEWQIAYRVYHWLVENVAYDYAGDRWAGNSLDKAYQPDMVPARMASFRAEGPLLYEVGVCFGYAKAAALLLGLEGIDARRVVSFSEEYLGWQPGRTWTFGDTIQVHSYNYLRIDGYDYLFDLSFAKDNKLSVATTSGPDAVLGSTKDYCVGLSKEEHLTVYPEFPDDPYTRSGEYNPGSYHYLTNITYDGTHALLLSSQAEAQAYYTYLLNTVFSQGAEFRSVTLFYTSAAYSSQKLQQFLNSTGVPYESIRKDAVNSRTGADVMVKISFGK